MRFLIPYFFGAATCGTFMCLYLAFREPAAPEPPSATIREVWDLRGELAEEQARRTAAERRANLWEIWAAIYRNRLADLGQPQSWPGVDVSTIYAPSRAEPPDVANPETIPPPAVPFPTRESSRVK